MNNREALKRKVARLTDAEIKEVLEYIDLIESMRADDRRPELLGGVYADFFVDPSKNRILRRGKASAR